MARLNREDDALRLVLDGDEVEVLTSLAVGLAQRIDEALRSGDSDPVLDRLTPPVSRGDEALDAELRAMIRGDLLSIRSARLLAFAAELRPARADASGGLDLRLDRAAAMRALEALNDLRLALATTIGFEELARTDLDPEDERQDALQLLDALAWLQGGLIEYVDGED